MFSGGHRLRCLRDVLGALVNVSGGGYGWTATREHQMTTLKTLREDRKMSKAKLAREFGVTERTIYAWEKGEPVKPLVVHAYADVFDVAADEIDAVIARYMSAA